MITGTISGFIKGGVRGATVALKAQGNFFTGESFSEFSENDLPRQVRVGPKVPYTYEAAKEVSDQNFGRRPASEVLDINGKVPVGGKDKYIQAGENQIASKKTRNSIFGLTHKMTDDNGNRVARIYLCEGAFHSNEYLQYIMGHEYQHANTWCGHYGLLPKAVSEANAHRWSAEQALRYGWIQEAVNQYNYVNQLRIDKAFNQAGAVFTKAYDPPFAPAIYK